MRLWGDAQKEAGYAQVSEDLITLNFTSDAHLRSGVSFFRNPFWNSRLTYVREAFERG